MHLLLSSPVHVPICDRQGVLFLAAGPDADGVLLKEARLMAIRHPVHVVGATATPGFTEHWLLEAERAGP